jgi:hypothetical protein
LETFAPGSRSSTYTDNRSYEFNISAHDTEGVKREVLGILVDIGHRQMCGDWPSGGRPVDPRAH